MKKTIRVLLAALLLAVLLCGCGQNVQKDIIGTWSLYEKGEEDFGIIEGTSSLTFEKDKVLYHLGADFFGTEVSFDDDGTYQIDENTGTISTQFNQGVSTILTINYQYDGGDLHLFVNGNEWIKEKK